MVDPSHIFHATDYAVFGCTIAISISIGIFYAVSGGRQKTTAEYLVGGRSMKFLPVAISLMVSYESSIMMLGLPAEMYVYGVQWWWATVGYMTSHLLSIFVVVPIFHPLHITSAFEYLELRFQSSVVRKVGSVMGCLSNLWYMGIVLFGPAIALEAVTGFSQWNSIFVVACVAVVYTTMGGLKAVIWTDVFQAVIMYSGMLAILIKGTMEVGSPSRVWQVAKEGGRLNFFNFGFDPRTRHTFWNLYLSNVLKGFSLVFNQSTVQRISSTRTQKDAKKMMYVMVPCHFAALTLGCYEGIVAYAYFQTTECDPLASKKISNPNQVIPYSVMDMFMGFPGMPGLFLASLFSASLSTLSSGLSSISALFWTDFVKPHIGPVSEVKATVIAKVTVIGAGVLACGVALLVSQIGGPLSQISGSLISAFSGPLTGIFLLGCFCRRANAKGAIIGGLLSLGMSSWIGMGMSFVKGVRREPWLPPASTAKCLANHSLALLADVTTASGSFNFSDVDVTMSYSDLDLGVSGVEEGVNYYHHNLLQTTMDSIEATTVSDTGPQGVGHLYTISYTLVGPLGIVLTVLLGYVFSLCTASKDDYADPKLLMTFGKLFKSVLGRSDDVEKEGDAAEDAFLADREIIIPHPSRPTDHIQLPLTVVKGSHEAGNDVTDDVTMENGANGIDVKRSTPPPPEDGDVVTRAV